MLQGGLGNLLFQIAATNALAWRNNTKAVYNPDKHHLPSWPASGRFVSSYTDNIFRSVEFSNDLKMKSLYREPHFRYAEIPYSDGLVLHGYFQSEKYFLDCTDKIRKLFSVDDKTRTYILNKYGDFLNENPTSIHIRRGDYLDPRWLNKIVPICTKEYYAQAMSKFPKDTKYMVFSDDPEWCQKVFKSERFKVVVGEEDHIDMYIMSMCKNHIIANSTFSWWGAWLNENQDKIVISPKEWFAYQGPQDTQDQVPENWLIL
tara:strand:- start:209 stop:988 length:780 start_codon:yes stop_codon:yes gene_type:complete